MVVVDRTVITGTFLPVKYTYGPYVPAHMHACAHTFYHTHTHTLTHAHAHAHPHTHTLTHTHTLSISHARSLPSRARAHLPFAAGDDVTASRGHGHTHNSLPVMTSHYQRYSCLVKGALSPGKGGILFESANATIRFAAFPLNPGAAPSPPPAPAPQHTAVFVSGTEGYHTFRIPSMLRMESGALLVFAEGRKLSAADHGWNDIVLKRSADNGTTWSPLELVYSESTKTKSVCIGNPAPVSIRSEPGKVVLVFCRDNSDVLQLDTADEGKTWSKIRDITSATKYPKETFIATGTSVSWCARIHTTRHLHTLKGWGRVEQGGVCARARVCVCGGGGSKHASHACRSRVWASNSTGMGSSD